MQFEKGTIKRNYFHEVVDKVELLTEGQTFSADMVKLQESAPSFEHKGIEFNPADRVMGRIKNSNYTHTYEINQTSEIVIFRRHPNTGAIRYLDPDYVGDEL